MKKTLKKSMIIALGFIVCWLLFVAFEGLRLIGSTDPGKYPLLRVSGIQAGDVCAEYNSLGFTQYYKLAEGDTFVYGEFRVLGIRVARWE